MQAPGAEVVVAKLDDDHLLRNYCTFAGLHRARILTRCFHDLGAATDADERRTLALQILGEYVSTLEDVAQWFYVLREWRLGHTLLFDELDQIGVRDQPGSKYSTETALKSLDEWQPDKLREELGLPNDQTLRSRGFSDAQVEIHREGIREYATLMKQALEFRSQSERALVVGWNKTKHGMLVVATTEASRSGVSMMIASRSGPKDQATGRRQINVGWLPCDHEEIARFVNTALLVSNALWGVLNLLYWAHFDQTWTLPVWPFELV